jgi:hypothetical protein
MMWPRPEIIFAPPISSDDVPSGQLSGLSTTDDGDEMVRLCEEEVRRSGGRLTFSQAAARVYQKLQLEGRTRW